MPIHLLGHLSFPYQTPSENAFRYVCVHMYMSVHVCMCVCTYTCVCLCVCKMYVRMSIPHSQVKMQP